MVGRGRVSAAGAVDIAIAIEEDDKNGDIPPAVAALASLGAHGAYPGNAERDMLKWLDSQFGFHVQPYKISLKVQDA